MTNSPKGATVLVVDDEPTVRMLIVDVLEDAAHTVIEAQNAASALVILRSTQKIDLLITDVGLPGGMNGRQMADAARQVRPDLKILFITGYAQNAMMSPGQLAPGMHVMTKPFSIDGLSSKVDALIEAV